MKVISITGGVGSGKSRILEILKDEYDAEIMVADLMAHQVMEPGREAYGELIALLGREILSPDLTIDRSRMSERLFKDPALVDRVNSIVHPTVWRRIEEEISCCDRELAVVEAALFDEVHNAMFDEIWYVYTPVEERIRRLMENRGYTREKCLTIMENQASEDTYRSFADRVIDNSGSFEQVRSQIKEILKEDK